MYQSFEPMEQRKKLGKNPVQLRMLDEQLIKLDRIAIKRSRQFGKTMYRSDCMREAITQYIARELGND